MSKASKSMNHSAWEGHGNEARFMDALTNFMNESWSMVCQVRERSGLPSQYEMSSTEISRRIEQISKKLEDKYQEVKMLEEQKSVLLNKSSASASLGAGAPPGLSKSISRQAPPANFQPLASSTPARPHGYSGNYTMSYSATNSSGSWPSSTSGASSLRRRPQYSSSCSSSCQNYSEGSSGAYRSFEGVDY